MTEKQETTADVIAEMRFHGQQNIDAEKDKPEYGILTVEGRIIQNFADRLEAAHKREKSAIEADALAVGGIVGATAEKSSAVGDVAKLREAAKYVQSTMERLHDPTDKNNAEFIRIWEIASAALAAPPRNCDVGSPKEQNERHNKFCYDHRSYERCCGGCPLNGEPCCELAWAQLPYESVAAK